MSFKVDKFGLCKALLPDNGRNYPILYEYPILTYAPVESPGVPGERKPSMKDLSYFEEKPKLSESIFEGKVVHLFRDTVVLPDGRDATREICRHVGAVCVVPLTAENEVICVRQYRYAHGEVLLEIPAGKLECKEENHEQAALRELREETGAVAGRITPLGPLYSSPAIFDEVIFMYLCEDLTFGPTHFDEDEFIETVRIPLEELKDRVLRGEIPDAKTQAAVMRVWAMKQGREGK